MYLKIPWIVEPLAYFFIKDLTKFGDSDTFLAHISRKQLLKYHLPFLVVQMIDLFLVQKVNQVCIMSTIILKSPYQVNTGTGYPPPSLRRELTEAYAATSYSLNDSLTLVTHPSPCPISPMCSPWPAS